MSEALPAAVTSFERAIARTQRGAPRPTGLLDPGRIRTSALFQYRTYQRARALIRDRRNARVLDLGCGTAHKAVELLIPNCANTAASTSLSRWNTAARTFMRRTPNSGWTTWNLPRRSFDSPFDLIVCADVIEHLQRPERLIRYAAANCRTSAGWSFRRRSAMSCMAEDAIAESGPRARMESRGAARILRRAGLEVRTLKLAARFRSQSLHAGEAPHPRATGAAARIWGCQVAICARDE